MCTQEKFFLRINCRGVSRKTQYSSPLVISAQNCLIFIFTYNPLTKPSNVDKPNINGARKNYAQSNGKYSEFHDQRYAFITHRNGERMKASPDFSGLAYTKGTLLRQEKEK
jgi:hypothetical protein